MVINSEHIQGVSHTGYRRQRNEDRFLIRHVDDSGALLAVADGVGGEVGGDIAAQTVVDILQELPLNSSADELHLADFLKQAGKQIFQITVQRPELEGMGTTATVVLVRKENVYWAHVGDSRLYHLSSGQLQQITTDHTFVQDLIEDGTLTSEEAQRHPLRNMLDQCVGCSSLEVEKGCFKVKKSDRLLLCSDGLTKHVADQELEVTLGEGNARQSVQGLLEQSLKAGGKDNIAIVVMDVK